MAGPENPSAFPQSLSAEGPFGGMILRDWFAGQALAGDLASQSVESGEWPNEPGWSHVDGRVKLYYRFADAMLAERERGQ